MDGGHGAAMRLSKIFAETGMVVTRMKPLLKHIDNASVADYHGKFLYFTGGQHYYGYEHKQVFAYDLRTQTVFDRGFSELNKTRV